MRKVRSLYLEIPRAEFASRFNASTNPCRDDHGNSTGLGRIAAEFCATLASEGSPID